MAEKMSPKQLIEKISETHNSVPRMLADEVEEIVEGSELVETLMRSGCGLANSVKRSKKPIQNIATSMRNRKREGNSRTSAARLAEPCRKSSGHVATPK